MIFYFKKTTLDWTCFKQAESHLGLDCLFSLKRIKQCLFEAIQKLFKTGKILFALYHFTEYYVLQITSIITQHISTCPLATELK